MQSYPLHTHNVVLFLVSSWKQTFGVRRVVSVADRTWENIDLTFSSLWVRHSILITSTFGNCYDDSLHLGIINRLHQHLHHLPPSIYSGPLSRNPLYPLLEHGALCFILLSNDVLPSYDVWVDFRCPIGGWWIAMIDLICLWLCCCPLVPIIWARAWITP